MKKICGSWLGALVLLLAPLAGSGNPLPYEDRLWVEARINGKPVRLILDTGTSTLILLTQTASRLGLVYTNPDEKAEAGPGRVMIGRTEMCELQVGTNVLRTCLGVYKKPDMLPTRVDGFIGWSNIRNNIMQIEAERGRITSLDQVPPAVTNWTACKLVPGADLLRFELPQPDRSAALIFVDTGNESGVKLPSDRWQAWKREHAGQPLTMDAYYTPAVGLVVREEGWAHELPLGRLLVRDVPVGVADKADSVHGDITLGMAALKRLDVIVDGKHGMAYLQPKTTPAPPYKYNRLGAVFTPKDLQHEDFLAHLIEGSPAWEAGIRAGDVLLRIGTLDVTKWRTDPTVMPMHRFWSRPAGTKHLLTLRRDAREYQVEVVLRDILGPHQSGK